MWVGRSISYRGHPRGTNSLVIGYIYWVRVWGIPPKSGPLSLVIVPIYIAKHSRKQKPGSWSYISPLITMNNSASRQLES